MMAWGVEIYLTHKKVRAYHLDVEEVLIGRSPDCHIHLPPLMISRHHAHLLPQAEGVVLEDLKSTNGTYVSHQPIQRVTLTHGQVFAIGPYRFRIIQDPAGEDFVTLKEQPKEMEVLGRKTSILDKELKEKLLNHLEDTVNEEEI